MSTTRPASASELRAASGDTSLDLGDRNEAWDAGEAKKALDPDDYKRAFFWRDPQGDPKTLAAYKLPFASPDGGLHAVWKAVHSAAGVIQGSMGGAHVPDADVPGIKTKIEAFYAKARKKYGDDSIVVPWSTSKSRERVALSPITGIEVRDAVGTGDGSWTIEGYAAVFEAETTLYDLSFMRMREVISRGAFSDVLAKPHLVHLNFGHDMNTAVASTAVQGIGGLELSEDFHGLRFFARVDSTDPDAIRLAAKMRRGVVSQASFAFTIDDEELVDDDLDAQTGQWDSLWRINRVRDLFDVCCAAQGAYPQTESHLRSLAAASFGRAGSPAGRPDRASAGPELIAPPGGLAVVPQLTELHIRRRREYERARALHPQETT